MENKKITFLYPITDNSISPRIHFTDLLVVVEVQIGRAVKTSVKSILYTEKGTNDSFRVWPLLKAIAPKLVEDIKAAAQEKAVAEFEQLCINKFQSQ